VRPPEAASAILTVDLTALVENWKLLSARLRPARCAAVVKADAYGLGADRVVRALLRAGCREFFVALVEEGIRLRETLQEDWPADARLHVLHGALPGCERDCLAHDLVPVLNSLDQIERWQALARAETRVLPAAIQGDTGMARLGLSALELARLDAEPVRLDGIAPTLVMSHLASAEESANPINLQQLQRFRGLRARWPQALGSLANSSGVFLGPEFHFDLARPGAALYGVAPTAGAPNPMRPVARVQGRLIQWREVAAGQGVGYNHTWHAQRASRIATVSVGYADGYLRSLSGHAQLRFHGNTVPLVGRVSMDTVTVDVTDVPAEHLHPGALFDLIDEVQDINALAAQAGTNAYEILTSLGPRYRRHYLES
jgi:alanine racemase